MRPLLLAAALALSLGIGPVAEAGTGLDTLRFRPAGSPEAGGLLEAVGVGQPGAFDAGVWLYVARRPVVFTDSGVPAADAVVAGRFAAVLRVGYAAGDRFRVGLDLPIVLYQAGVDPSTVEPLPAGGLGDLRIVPHVQILDPRRKWLGLAFSLPITVPTGRTEGLLSEGLPTIHPRVVAEKTLQSPVHPLLRFTLGLEAGYHLRPPTQLLDLDTAGAFTFGLGLRWHGLDFLRIGTEAVGALGQGENFRHGEWITWAELRVDRRRHLAITAGVSVGLGRGVGTPEGRVFGAFRATIDPRAAAAHPPEEPPEIVEAVPGPEDQPPLPGTDIGWGLRLVDRPASIDARVLFDVDSASLRSPARPLLDAVARWYLGHRGAGRLLVEGHADPRGSGGHNQALSQRRAEAVRAHLVSAGVPESALDLRAFGERRPASSRDVEGADRWASDRRVVFAIVAKPSSSEQARSR